MEQSNEIVVCEDSEVKVGAEVRDGLLFCHCYIKTEPSMYLMKKLKIWWAIIKEEAYISGFDYIHTYTPNIKFCKVLDDSFDHLGTIEVNGEKLEVLRWELIRSLSLSLP